MRNRIRILLLTKAVFRICDILVRIRIPGSVRLTKGSGSGSGSWSFPQWPSRCLQKIFGTCSSGWRGAEARWSRRPSAPRSTAIRSTRWPASVGSMLEKSFFFSERTVHQCWKSRSGSVWFGPPGSGSVSTRYGSRSHLSSSKNSKKKKSSFLLFCDFFLTFFSLKNDVNVAPRIRIINKEKLVKKLFFVAIFHITFWNSKNCRNQGFSNYFCLMREGSESVHLNNGSGRPRNIRNQVSYKQTPHIFRIEVVRTKNLANKAKEKDSYLCRKWDEPFLHLWPAIWSAFV